MSSEPIPQKDPGVLANNGMLVKMLQTALSRSETNLNTIPRLIGQVIDREMWREWIDGDGRPFRWSPADFRRFIEDPRPAGCHTPIPLVRKALAGTDAAPRFEQLIRGKQGNPDHESQPRSDDGSFMRRNRDIVTVTDRDSDDPPTIPSGPVITLARPQPATRPLTPSADCATTAPTCSSASTPGN